VASAFLVAALASAAGAAYGESDRFALNHYGAVANFIDEPNFGISLVVLHDDFKSGGEDMTTVQVIMDEFEGNENDFFAYGEIDPGDFKISRNLGKAVLDPVTLDICESFDEDDDSGEITCEASGETITVEAIWQGEGELHKETFRDSTESGLRETVTIKDRAAAVTFSIDGEQYEAEGSTLATEVKCSPLAECQERHVF
jgi:hypothetical protein